MVDQEAIVREFLAAWGSGDAGKLADFFTEDAAVWNDARTTVHGREAIHEHLKGHLSLIADVEIEVTALAVSGNTVFTERIDRLKVGDVLLVLPVAGVFEFASDGKMMAWRDYFDLNTVMEQLQAAGIPTDGTATPPAG